MKMYLVIYNRDFTARHGGERLNYTVTSMSWEAIGGCHQAMVEVSGPELDLWELIYLLRCPVEIYDENGRACWWGMLRDAVVRTGALEIGATIDSMTNRVAVSYTEVTPGSAGVGTAQTTAWADNLDSQAEYGIREWIEPAGNLSAAAALTRRSTLLARQGLPAGVGAVNPFNSGKVRTASATLTLAGWWDTLAWKYASWPAVAGPKYETIVGPTSVGIADAAARTKIMQSFSVSTASINVLSVDLYIKKVNAPGDNLVVEIFNLDRTLSTPTGSALSSANIAAAAVGTSFGWVNINLPDVQLPVAFPHGMYGLVLSRSGAVDAVNYYAIGADATIVGGVQILYLYNGTSWSVRSPTTEANFRVLVNDDIETATQIHDLAANFGQFLSDVTVDDVSGTDLPSYRAGTTTALEELKELMENGGPNGRRYLAEISIERVMRAWEEPAAAETFQIDSDGRPYDLIGSESQPWWYPPVGQWLRLRDVIPAGIDTSLLVDPTLQFLEGAEWTAQGGLAPRFRGQKTVEEMLREVLKG